MLKSLDNQKKLQNNKEASLAEIRTRRGLDRMKTEGCSSAGTGRLHSPQEGFYLRVSA